MSRPDELRARPQLPFPAGERADRWPEVLRAHAARSWPEECCGALLADASGLISARPLENTATDRRNGFQVSARESLRLEADAEAEGLFIAGFYHSHPDGPATPSASDAESAWPGRWTVIVPVMAGVAGAPRAFRFDDTTRRFHEEAVAIAEN